jgi:hypothetical protein
MIVKDSNETESEGYDASDEQFSQRLEKNRSTTERHIPWVFEFLPLARHDLFNLGDFL